MSADRQRSRCSAITSSTETPTSVSRSCARSPPSSPRTSGRCRAGPAGAGGRAPRCRARRARAPRPRRASMTSRPSPSCARRCTTSSTCCAGGSSRRFRCGTAPPASTVSPSSSPSATPATHALAIEWLDVTLTGPEHSVVALLEPNLSLRERLHRLNRSFPLSPLSPRAVLLELVRDDDARWRPWIKACAVHAASLMAPADLDLLAEVARGLDPDAQPRGDRAPRHGRGLSPAPARPGLSGEPTRSAISATDPWRTLVPPGRVAQLARALPLQGRCRGFESLRAHQKRQCSGAPRARRTARYPGSMSVWTSTLQRRAERPAGHNGQLRRDREAPSEHVRPRRDRRTRVRQRRNRGAARGSTCAPRAGWNHRPSLRNLVGPRPRRRRRQHLVVHREPRQGMANSADGGSPADPISRSLPSTSSPTAPTAVRGTPYGPGRHADAGGSGHLPWSSRDVALGRGRHPRPTVAVRRRGGGARPAAWSRPECLRFDGSPAYGRRRNGV